MNYYGVIGNRDYIKFRGEKRPYWEFLDRQPDGWLSSLTYKRKDLPDAPTIMDCGAWSYKHEEVPPVDAESVIPAYMELARPGSILIAPDHMLIDGVDHQFRRKWNEEQARRFLDVCPSDYTPMACIHGDTLDERLEHATALMSAGYTHLAIGGVAARASQRKLVLAIVAALREVTAGAWLHVLGLSSPSFVKEWRRLGVNSCDGSSHFKQAFTGGAFFTVNGEKLSKHQAVRPGEDASHLPQCECVACSKLASDGIDTRSYGSNEHNMGRAAHNQNMLMSAQREALKQNIVLVACCGEKLPEPSPAGELYQSALFKKAKAYAENFGDRWFILSAKYGLISPGEVVEPYDERLSDKDGDYRKAWNHKILHALRGAGVTDADRVTVLAGKDYCGWIEGCGLNVKRPMAGMGIGQQLQWLTKECDDNGDQRLLF